MKAAFTSLGLALGASAASLTPRDQCCFGLTASGGVSGTVGQLSDGQNRIAQTAGLDNQAGQYCLSNGEITDGEGRGCILTPPTTQFQCDVGATPSGGFSVSNGELTHNGDTTFYACPTGDNGGYNIYTTPVSGQDLCVEISLSTGGKCSAASSASSSVASSATSAPATSKAASLTTVTAPASVHTIYSTDVVTITSCGSEVTNCPAESTVVSTAIYSTVVVKTSAAASTTTKAVSTAAAASSTKVASTSAAAASSTKVASTSAAASHCPTDLSGAYQIPHAIVPVNAQSPETSYGTQYFAYIEAGANSTIFNFDIPSSYSGKECSIIFLFPKQSELETSSFTLAGSGGLKFDLLSSTAALDSTYKSAPSVKSTLAEIDSVTPGNSYLVSSGSCPAGTSYSVEVSATGSLDLEYFQDYNPSPIGLFVTAC